MWALFLEQGTLQTAPHSFIEKCCCFDGIVNQHFHTQARLFVSPLCPSKSFHTPLDHQLKSFNHISKRRRAKISTAHSSNTRSCLMWCLARREQVREQCGSSSHTQEATLRNVPAHTVQAICCVLTLNNIHSCRRTINMLQKRQTCSGENAPVEGKKDSH